MKQNREESGNDVTDLENEDRPRSPLKRTEQMQKWHIPSRVVRRSDRPCRFREVEHGMQMRHLNK